MLQNESESQNASNLNRICTFHMFFSYCAESLAVGCALRVKPNLTFLHNPWSTKYISVHSMEA
jgi:hypothetical protein